MQFDLGPFFTRACCLVLFSIAISACGESSSKSTDPEDTGQGDTGQEGTDTGDETDNLFDPNRVIDVQIEIASKDWDVLRYEGRGLATLFSGCKEDLEYTYFNAVVTIDGTKIENVGIRKKGYLGSLSAIRPSIKLHFGKFIEGQTYSGMKRMTLNNDRQDPSHTHQVMSYSLFRQAGVVAPRSNFAQVTVNGEDLGFYTHVESIKKPFLARHFDDNEGNLYEGQGADFTPEMVSYFERKTNEGDGTTEPDRSDLDAVTAALQLDNFELIPAIEQLVDLDAFIAFWAMEVIIGHWDGYTGDRNNFYIYRDPLTDLFYFIPWGTDGTFAQEHSFLSDIPRSVYAWGHLAHRLYNHPQARALYHEKVQFLLEELWDQEALLAEADRIEALTSADSFFSNEARDFLSSQKNAIQSELTDGGPEWPYPAFSEARECNTPIEISGSFHARWYTAETFTPHSDISLTLTLDGELQTFSALYNAAGPDEETSSFAAIRFFARRTGKNPLMLLLAMPLSTVKEGELPMHALEVFGMVFEINEAEESGEQLGYIGNGTIIFESAGTEEGSDVIGSFQGLLSQ